MQPAATLGSQTIHYPECDGEPMGETEVHIDALIALRQQLLEHFRAAPDVYVNGDMLMYYEEGNPKAVVVPDVFVVRGLGKYLAGGHRRRIYKLWEEGRAPSAVFEITSRSTRLVDVGQKRALYQMLGVEEYFLFNPLAEYLEPPLQVYRLASGEYQRLEAGAGGGVTSAVLDLEFRVEDGLLVVRDPATGESLRPPEEYLPALEDAEQRAVSEAAERALAEERAACESERAARESERAARESERAASAEAELARLRDEIDRK